MTSLIEIPNCASAKGGGSQLKGGRFQLNLHGKIIFLFFVTTINSISGLDTRQMKLAEKGCSDCGGEDKKTSKTGGRRSKKSTDSNNDMNVVESVKDITVDAVDAVAEKYDEIAPPVNLSDVDPDAILTIATSPFARWHLNYFAYPTGFLFVFLFVIKKWILKWKGPPILPNNGVDPDSWNAQMNTFFSCGKRQAAPPRVRITWMQIVAVCYQCLTLTFWGGLMKVLSGVLPKSYSSSSNRIAMPNTKQLLLYGLPLLGVTFVFLFLLPIKLYIPNMRFWYEYGKPGERIFRYNDPEGRKNSPIYEWYDLFWLISKRLGLGFFLALTSFFGAIVVCIWAKLRPKQWKKSNSWF